MASLIEKSMLIFHSDDLHSKNRNVVCATILLLSISCILNPTPALNETEYLSPWYDGLLEAGNGPYELSHPTATCITGLCVRVGTYIDAISASFNNGFTTSFYGGTAGTMDCYSVIYGASFTSALVITGARIEGLQFTASNGNTTPHWGGSVGSSHTAKAISNTCISKIWVYTYADLWIDAIRFAFQITPNPTQYPTSFPTTAQTVFPTFPTSQPTSIPTSDPTLIPTSYPTLYPTLMPTSDPTLIPTSDPTLIPTTMTPSTTNPTMAPSSFAPTTSIPTTTSLATSRYKYLYFICGYNDNRDYIAQFMTFIDYAAIMTDSVVSAVQSISYFVVCYIFDTELENQDEECPAYSTLKKVNIDKAEYGAVAIFEIETNEDLNAFKKEIMKEMESDPFKDIFTKKMNDELMKRMSLEYSDFDALYIYIIDPNDVDIDGDLTLPKRKNTITIVIIVVPILIVFIVFISLIFYWKMIYEKNSAIEGEKKAVDADANNEIEMEGIAKGANETADKEHGNNKDAVNDILEALAETYDHAAQNQTNK